ncbi:unnamed protein product, partial [Rotaria socialis]
MFQTLKIYARLFPLVALGGIPASPSISLSKVSAVVDESEFCIGNTPKISRVKEEHHDVDNEKHPAITKIEGKHNNRNRHLILRPHSSPSTLRAFKTALYHVSTLKRRPSPSTSSLSSNSSCDRRAAPIQLTKFGTQSPDAVNKLLRLSDSSHQIKARAPQRPNQPPASSNTSSTSTANPTSPIINNITTSTGLSSFAEPSLPHRHQHLAK